MKITAIEDNPGGVHQKTPKRREKRVQHQIRFNLNLRRADESLLAEDIETLRQRRQFRPTIIKALRLFFDLRDGSIDLLAELFPEAIERIQQRGQNAEIEALRREIADLRSLTFNAPMSPAHTSPAANFKLVKGIMPATGKAFANSVGSYFD